MTRLAQYVIFIYLSGDFLPKYCDLPGYSGSLPEHLPSSLPVEMKWKTAGNLAISWIPNILI
ncbi:hypothetical protein [Thiolapillus sp.]|uniref:hypothetical protein n=1 Tax=Thiolapillus sp. TaxID=2017437 RepID=UPI0025FDCFEC|nr:hypothetical protein [Thiolapillus sp.]